MLSILHHKNRLVFKLIIYQYIFTFIYSINNIILMNCKYIISFYQNENVKHFFSRKFQPKTMAKQYENNLRYLITSLSDYRGRFGFPKHWPKSLKNFELVVET